MTQTLAPLSELATAAGVEMVNFVPGGAEPNPLPDLYLTYTLIPGEVAHASDGGGAYATEYQLDVYARGVATARDPVARSVGTAEALMRALPPGVWLVQGPPRPDGVVDEQGFSRTMLRLRRFHSL